MKNRILSSYPHSTFISTQTEMIYVADFSERTGCKRNVEVHEAMPYAPGSQEEMDCLKLNNSATLSIDFNIFDDNQFKNELQKDCEHCECCLFPTENNEKTWIAFIEIKDCKPKNISVYKNKVKEQILSTVKLFKQQGIIGKQKIYGIVSFPKKKTSFNQTIFEDYAEYNKLYHSDKIRFLAANELYIKDHHYIDQFKPRNK